MQIQHNCSSGGGDPSAMHVFYQRAHKGREVFTFSSQTSSMNNEVILQTPLGPTELKCTFFPPVFTDITTLPASERQLLVELYLWFSATQWKQSSIPEIRQSQ